jgi:hypothetical protein
MMRVEANIGVALIIGEYHHDIGFVLGGHQGQAQQ